MPEAVVNYLLKLTHVAQYAERVKRCVRETIMRGKPSNGRKFVLHIKLRSILDHVGSNMPAFGARLSTASGHALIIGTTAG